MRYLVLYRSESSEEGGAPDPGHMAIMGRYAEEQTRAGVLLGTEPLGVRALGGRVRLSDGAFTVAEEDGRMSGYAFLNAPSKAAVIEQCKDFLKVAGDGSCEIRQILEFGPPAG